MKKRLLVILIVISAFVLLTGCIQTRGNLVYQSPHEYEQLRIDMIDRVIDSVVQVRTDSGSGSGIIFKQENLANNVKRYSILTNYHVIENGGEMSIYRGDVSTIIPVTDYAGNASYDVAVVRIETTEQLVVHSSPVLNENKRIEIVIAQDVYAIGTPQGTSNYNYVTSGIVSLLNRSYNGISNLTIMHNAELNPGNSGGPLFNLNGDLIAINVAKIATVSSSDDDIPAEGLNFSLNINTIAPVVRSFSESDYTEVVRRPRLGVTVQEIETFLVDNDASLLPENPVGVVVVGIDESRNAFGKIEIYDLVVEMNGVSITSIDDIAEQLTGAEFGDSHTLKVLRKVNGSFVEFTYTIILS